MFTATWACSSRCPASAGGRAHLGHDRIALAASSAAAINHVLDARNRRRDEPHAYAAAAARRGMEAYALVRLRAGRGLDAIRACSSRLTAILRSSRSSATQASTRSGSRPTPQNIDRRRGRAARRCSGAPYRRRGFECVAVVLISSPGRRRISGRSQSRGRRVRRGRHPDAAGDPRHRYTKQFIGIHGAVTVITGGRS